MNNKESKNNIADKKVKSEDRGFNLWLGEDNIIRVWLGKFKFDEEIEKSLNEEINDILNKQPNNSLKVLVDLTSSTHIPSTAFRKWGANFLKDKLKEPGFKKIAFWGGGILPRVVTSFIITATSLKNVRLFKIEDEALKWLKED